MKKRRKQYKVDVTVKYIPLPPEKQAAYDYAMELLAEMLLDIGARKRQEEREKLDRSENEKDGNEEKTS
jgi:hypothetical protein